MKFAVIGTGIIGRLRAQTVSERDGTELVAVADPNQDAAKDCANRFGGEFFDDYRKLFDATNPDAVIISSPVQLHEEMAIAAIASGCHVLCEKPMSNSHPSCMRILDAAKKAGKTVAVGFNHRYYPSISYLKQVIDDGLIGKIDHLRIFSGHDGLANLREDWMYKGELSGGGAMMDCGIHMTDLARFVGGELKEVYGISRSDIWKIPGSEDNAMAIFKTVDNVPISYHATWTEWKGYHFSVEAYGELGMVKGYYAPMYNLFVSRDPKTGKRTKKRKFYPELILKEKIKGWQSTSYDTFVKELDDFLSMIDGNQVDLASGWCGARSIEVAQAVYESERSGQVVQLQTPPA
ncbi:MAG: putative dehydrogenase [Planctomycetota bacterium]|jgi:predicted dehydrogenase